MDNYEQTEEVSLKNHAIKWGLILGVVSVIMTLLLYIVDITLMADWKFSIIIIIVSIGLIVYAGIDFRKQNGGFLPFKKAFTVTFLTLIISGIISTIFSILLFTVIDPEAAEVVSDAIVDKTEVMMEGFGMDDDAIEEAMEKVREDSINRFTIGGLMKQFLFSVIGSAIFALIIGAIIKRNHPEEEI